MDSRHSTTALIIFAALVCMAAAARSAPSAVSGDVRGGFHLTRTYRTLCISAGKSERTIAIDVLYDAGTKSVAVRCDSEQCSVVFSDTPGSASLAPGLRTA